VASDLAPLSDRVKNIDRRTKGEVLVHIPNQTPTLVGNAKAQVVGGSFPLALNEVHTRDAVRGLRLLASRS
jgi:hypothetical protein